MNHFLIYPVAYDKSNEWLVKIFYSHYNRPMGKIQMQAIAELDGDEMTRVLWGVIKEKLLTPYIDLNTEYYDLGLKNRDDTDDKVTREAADAVKKLKVGVKCATITSNKARMTEYGLKQLTPSPNAIIRAALDGTVFRKPIIVSNIHGTVNCWEKPIVIARHAFADLYKASEIKTTQGGVAELVFTGDDGVVTRKTIAQMNCPGILQGIFNLDTSIESFAHCVFEYALSEKMSVWFGAKDTISKIYDGNFKNIFQKVFDSDYKDKFATNNLEYFYTLIDDCVARVMKTNGGFIWACKNYDGDVMSDMVASACGSLAMMTSVLVSPDGCYEYEASHGTVQKHFYRYKKGEKTSTNPVALIFAWTGALRKRAEFDNNKDLADFSTRLEHSVISTIESGVMTGDIARIATPAAKSVVDSWAFIDAIRANLDK